MAGSDPFSPSPSGRRPTFRGVVMQDISQGSKRVRKWPKPRGKPKTQAQKDAQDKFRAAQAAAKWMAPRVVYSFTEACRGTPLMPRDLVTSMLYQRLLMIVDENGRKLWPMVAKSDVEEALSTITQAIGDILYLGPEGWTGRPGSDFGTATGPYIATNTSSQLNQTGDGTYFRLTTDSIVEDQSFVEFLTGPQRYRVLAPGCYHFQISCAMNGGGDQDWSTHEIYHNGALAWSNGLEFTNEATVKMEIGTTLVCEENDEIYARWRVGGGTKNLDTIVGRPDTAVRITKLS